MERQVQKEREKEEGQFNDKEAFVTEAYPFILDVTFWLRLQAVPFICCFRLGKLPCEQSLLRSSC